MTKEEAIEVDKILDYTKKVNSVAYKVLKELLEQESCEDVMAIHTQGLEYGIRCAMCTNSMKSDRGCNGSCMVDDEMYKKVMEVINKQMFEMPTSDDCVSRQAVFDIAKSSKSNWIDNSVLYKRVNQLPSVTPQPKIGHWIEHLHEAGENWEYSKYECSECHVWEDDDSDFCPKCGADMREAEE